MFFIRCNRKEFAKHLGSLGSRLLREASESVEIFNTNLKPEEIILCWGNSTDLEFSLPNLILVHEKSVTDFLAWVASYFREIEPFTAQCRVSTPSRVADALRPIQTKWSDAQKSIDIALIISEVAAYSIGTPDVTKLPFATYERSLSFAIAKALRQYGEFTESESEPLSSLLSALEDTWTRARDLAGETPLGLDAKTVREVWGIVLQSGSTSRNSDDKDNLDFIKSLRTFRREGFLDKRFLEVMPSGLLSPQATLFEMDDISREGRVLAFEEAAIRLSKSSKLSPRTRAFLLGFIASRISPGTLQHISVLFPFADQNRECLLWFGVFAGLSNNSDITTLSNGLGWILRREIERTIQLFDRPTCDISLEELAIYAHSNRGKRGGIRCTSHGILKIEIYPLITTNVRWPQVQPELIEGRSSSRSGQLFLDEERVDAEIARVLARLEETTVSIERIRKEIGRFKNKRS